LDDVGLADGAGGARLVHEAGHQRLVLGQLAPQDLDRDPTVQHRVLGDVHGTHPAFAQQRPDLVVIDLAANHFARLSLKALHRRPEALGVRVAATIARRVARATAAVSEVARVTERGADRRHAHTVDVLPRAAEAGARRARRRAEAVRGRAALPRRRGA